MESLLLAMAGFVLVGSITPGPVNVIATNTGLNAGIYKAFTYVLGASLSFSVVVFIAGLMLNEVSDLLPKVTLVMQIFGSAFLLYVAFQLSRASASFTDANENQSAGFWAGSFTQAINPKAWLFSSSGVSLYVVGRETENDLLLIFTLVSFVICMIGVGVWAVAGRLLRQHLNSESKVRRLNQVMAGLLVLCIVVIWL